jgi:hypothetical protein
MNRLIAEGFDEGDRVGGEIGDRVGIGRVAAAVPALVEGEEVKFRAERREQQFEAAPGIGEAVEKDDARAAGAHADVMMEPSVGKSDFPVRECNV